MHIDMDYETLANELPKNIKPAYDGMQFASSHKNIKK